MDTCYLGLDDGYFDISIKRSSSRSKTVLVGAVVCRDSFEDLFLDTITIDGLDAFSSAYRIMEKASAVYDIASVFLDGVTYAGFNIIDPDKLYSLSSLPTIVIFRHKLDLSKIRLALEKHFPDHRYRFKVIEHTYSKSFDLLLPHLPTVIKIYSVGMRIENASELVKKLCGIFAEPYPLRIADKLASTLGKVLTKNRTSDYHD